MNEKIRIDVLDWHIRASCKDDSEEESGSYWDPMSKALVYHPNGYTDVTMALEYEPPTLFYVTKDGQIRYHKLTKKQVAFTTAWANGEFDSLKPFKFYL